MYSSTNFDILHPGPTNFGSITRTSTQITPAGIDYPGAPLAALSPISMLQLVAGLGAGASGKRALVRF